MSATPEDAVAKRVANLKATTGRTLEEWSAVIASSGLQQHGQIVALLKADHGVTHGNANLIVQKARGTDSTSLDGGDLVEAMFAGGKESLRPAYDKVIDFAKSLGSDVELSPKKGYMSLRRKKQFAIVQPSTKDRLDLGLNLKGVAPTGKLEASGSFNAMVSHRVRLAGAGDVGADVETWLSEAYAAAG